MPFLMSEIVNDPDFAQVINITRSSGGAWSKGVWQDQTAAVTGWGIIQPSTPEELEQVPEGDRVKGAVTFHSSSVIYETHTTGPNDATTGISDIISWNSQTYRIAKVFPWQDFGYYKAIGVRMSGE